MEISGGDKLEQALKDIADKMSGSVDVGFLEGATYPEDGTPVAQVAFWNEFGTSKSPARPFFRSTITDKSGEWAERLGKSAVGFDYNADKTLKYMGQVIQEDIQQSINTWSEPPNAQSTVDKKGFNSPLRDTMHMLRSVDYEVKP